MPSTSSLLQALRISSLSAVHGLPSHLRHLHLLQLHRGLPIALVPQLLSHCNLLWLPKFRPPAAAMYRGRPLALETGKDFDF
jgi:hypothetical protein